ncbi:unnamed protein product [Absidia cylindrospora]
MSAITYPPDNTLVIGEVSHYHFYQSINQAPRTSSKYQPSKRIIPAIPRQHSKAPVNSPLSFIRQQKLPRHIHHTATPTSCRTPSSVNLLLPPVSSIEPPTTSSPGKTSTEPTHQRRPQLFTHSSADLLNLSSSPTKHPLSLGRRPRKVSFNENVMVICTRFDADEDDKDNVDSNGVDDDTKNDGRSNASSTSPTLVYQGRRHSTAGHIADGRRQQKRWLTFVEILKQWPSSTAA